MWQISVLKSSPSNCHAGFLKSQIRNRNWDSKDVPLYFILSSLIFFLFTVVMKNPLALPSRPNLGCCCNMEPATGSAGLERVTLWAFNRSVLERQRERDDRDCSSFGSYSSKACWWTEPRVSEMEADSSRVTLRPHIHFLPKVLSRHINPAIKLEAYLSPSFTSVSWRKGLILPPPRQCHCATNQRIRCLKQRSSTWLAGKPSALLPPLGTEWPVSCGKTSPCWQTGDKQLCVDRGDDDDDDDHD